MKKRRLTYANLMATTAVLISLTGGAYVAWALEKGSVRSFHIENGTVKTVDLAPGAVIGNARAVDGSSIKQINWTAPPNPAPPEWQKLFSLRGLTVHAYCSDNEDRVYLRVRGSVNESIFGVGVINEKTTDPLQEGRVVMPGVDNEFNAGEEAFVEIDDTVTVFSYGRGPNSSEIVTGTFLANQWAGGPGQNAGECKVVGTVVSS